MLTMTVRAHGRVLDTVRRSEAMNTLFELNRNFFMTGGAGAGVVEPVNR